MAVPEGVALLGLGYSLWREQRTPAAVPSPGAVASQLDPARPQILVMRDRLLPGK